MIRMVSRVSLALVVSAALTVVPVLAQNKPKPKPATPTQSKPAPPRATLGTKPIPGQAGKLGTAYTLGPKGQELNFTLVSAELHTRFVAADEVFMSKPDEKLLVMRFTAHNPLPQEQYLNYTAFQFSVVAPDDRTFTTNNHYYQVDKITPVDGNLKPAQKIEMFAIVTIHGTGPVNKVMVARNENAVLRYDLRETIKPLSGPYAANKTDSAAEGKASLNAPFEFGFFDVTVEKVEKATAAVGDYAPSDEQDLWFAYVTIKNATKQARYLNYNFSTTELLDDEDAPFESTSDLLRATSAQTIDFELPAEGQIRARIPFYATKGTTPKKLRLTDAQTERKLLIALP